MVIPGEIVKKGSYYAALVEALGAYGQGKTRRAACDALAATVLEIAADHRALDGFAVTVTDDGESTCYLASNDPLRLAATLLRCQRDLHGLSLAAVAQVLGAKSRDGYARYEAGRSEPSIGKLAEVLAAVAPEYMLAVVPRTARVIPRWEEEADDAPEIEALLRDPSPANVQAFRAKRPKRERSERPARKAG